MSCNDPFFETSRRVVHDTWAKELIEGKFEGCTFYSYTASKDGQEKIEDNCIYVNTPDDVCHTYIKTIRAMKCLRDCGITWDMIVRTNTSTFINIRKTIDIVNEGQGNLCGFRFKEENTYFPVGWYMFLPAELTYALIDNIDIYNEETDEIRKIKERRKDHLFSTDDILIGYFYDVLKKSNKIHADFYIFNIRIVSHHYKSYLRNHFVQPHKEYYDYNQHTDPKDILNHFVFQVRKPDVPTYLRYIECEHMYELNDVIQQHYSSH